MNTNCPAVNGTGPRTGSRPTSSVVSFRRGRWQRCSRDRDDEACEELPVGVGDDPDAADGQDGNLEERGAVKARAHDRAVGDRGGHEEAGQPMCSKPPLVGRPGQSPDQPGPARARSRGASAQTVRKASRHRDVAERFPEGRGIRVARRPDEGEMRHQEQHPGRGDAGATPPPGQGRRRPARWPGSASRGRARRRGAQPPRRRRARQRSGLWAHLRAAPRSRAPGCRVRRQRARRPRSKAASITPARRKATQRCCVPGHVRLGAADPGPSIVLSRRGAATVAGDGRRQGARSAGAADGATSRHATAAKATTRLTLRRPPRVVGADGTPPRPEPGVRRAQRSNSRRWWA